MKFRLITLIILLLVMTGLSTAQSDRATISGIVKDSTGAVISGAAVTVTNIKTNVENTATTGNQGTFTVLNLPIGEYTLQASKEGFGKYQRTGISLAISQVAQ